MSSTCVWAYVGPSGDEYEIIGTPRYQPGCRTQECDMLEGPFMQEWVVCPWCAKPIEEAEDRPSDC